MFCAGRCLCVSVCVCVCLCVSCTHLSPWASTEEGIIHVDTEGMSTAVRLKWFLGTSRFGQGLRIANVVLSFLSCCAYIAETYDTDQSLHGGMRVLHIFTIAFFLAHFLLGLFIAKKRLAALMSFDALGDLVSMMPALVIWASDRTIVVRLLRLAGVVRVSHIKDVSRYMTSDIKKQLFRCVFVWCMCVCVCVCLCACVHVCVCVPVSV